jgi:NAD(P)H-flavin reductase
MKPKNSENIYLPYKSVIKQISDIGRDVKLFKVVPAQKTDYIPGQFFMVGRWGAGEVPISVASLNGRQRLLEFAIRKAGEVTGVLHALKKGDTLWLRGPYGRGFSTSEARKRDVVIIAGGIGIVPLRPLINLLLKNKKQFKSIFLLIGAKRPSDNLFEQDINIWKKNGVKVILTVDVKDKSWTGRVGLVTEHLDTINTDFKKAAAFTCGPEIMIEKTMQELSIRGMSDSRITTTLEARMKCGMGKCGQCYHGTEYICTNGPVYTYKEIKKRKVYGP